MGKVGSIVIDIQDLLCEGHSYATIAERLNISIAWVKEVAHNFQH
jgi:DNA-binding NarL/FixJ family response regulator